MKTLALAHERNIILRTGGRCSWLRILVNCRYMIRCEAIPFVGEAEGNLTECAHPPGAVNIILS